MTRFSGKVGYGESQEVPAGSGVWKDVITELPYSGDVIRNTRNLDTNDQINGNLTVGNSISIVADEYANQHFFKIKYVMWQGYPWVVTQIKVDHPRLVLTLGEIYNGPLPSEDD